MDMTIKDAMAATGLSVHTVRHYCDKGLVPNVGHDANGNRTFDAQSLNWLNMAQFLRSCGMPVAQVAHYFTLCEEGETTLPERCELLRDFQRQAQHDLEQAQIRLDYLSERVEHCDSILAGEEIIDDSNPLNWRAGINCQTCPKVG